MLDYSIVIVDLVVAIVVEIVVEIVILSSSSGEDVEDSNNSRCNSTFFQTRMYHRTSTDAIFFVKLQLRKWDSPFQTFTQYLLWSCSWQLSEFVTLSRVYVVTSNVKPDEETWINVKIR